MDKTLRQKLNRATFTTSRMMDFCSEKELTAQTGHARPDWPLVTEKELTDNGIDECEEAGVPPQIGVVVEPDAITITDNGRGIPASTVERLLDFNVRVSSREAYVAPDRGKQGNALKTILMMPFTLDGKAGHVEIDAEGVRHIIDVAVDGIRQQPKLAHQREKGKVETGTSVRVAWPNSANCVLTDARDRFLSIAQDYTWLNPHLTLTVKWMAEPTIRIRAIDQQWRKWGPSDPTSPHWYGLEHLKRLIGACVADDQDHRRDRLMRDFVAEFRGLSGTAKRREILDVTGLGREKLSSLVNGDTLDEEKVNALLAAMKAKSKPVKPADLGVIGKDNLMARFASVGCEMESFDYRKVAKETDDGLPFVLETAFGWLGEEALPQRRMVLGVNWSPALGNPFRQLGSLGKSLDSVLEEQRVGEDEPVIFFLHVACPRVEYTDRGKSAVVIRGGNDGKQ